jgi:glycosyltransferase involved in cell wall biosynthesis
MFEPTTSVSKVYPVEFSGIVVTYNEARRLRDCLDSLAFCEQLLVVDLGSTDGSAEIARECGAEVVNHKWVPVVEQVWPDAVSLTRHTWIIRADPDEVFPSPLVDDLVNMILKSPSLAMISLPHQYYFRGRPLKTTIWGGIKYAFKVFHKDRVQLESLAHRGITCKDGYELKCIESDSNIAIRHYWIDTFSQLFEKHWRYIEQEGEARYQLGEQFSWRRWVGETGRALKRNLIDYKGMHGGWLGIFLSTFYAWYVSMSLLSLCRYQKRAEKGAMLD